MASYLVTWSIDIDDAEDERHAAELARDIMQDMRSTALCFDVKRHGSRKKAVLVDLENEETAADELERSTR